MGVCCGKGKPKGAKKYEPAAKTGDGLVEVVSPPIPATNPTATQTGEIGGFDKTIITNSYLREIGRGHIYGLPDAPILSDDKSNKRGPSNYPAPPVPQKFVPNPDKMPPVDERNRDLHPTLINIYNPAVPPPQNNETPDPPKSLKVVVSPPANRKPEPAGPAMAGQLQEIAERTEVTKTISVISKIHADNSPQMPSVIELKPLPDVLPTINKAHFESVTSKVILLNPSTLNIELPQKLAFVTSIRPLPSVGPGAFEFISCSQVFTTGLDQNTATLGVSKPDSKVGLTRLSHMVELPAAIQAHHGRIHQERACVGLPQEC